jgi:hypothetical protein
MTLRKGEIKTARTRIDITDRDIARANRGDSYTCVVSQAVARTIKSATRIEVDTQTIRFTKDGYRYIYNTPPAVQGYVVGFDAGDPVEPFSFQLRDARVARMYRRTPAGKAVEKARSTERRRKPTKDRPVTKASVKAAYHAAAAAARAQGMPLRHAVDNTVAKTTPRVFKKKARSYGHRLLRINQDKGPAAQTAPTAAPNGLPFA